MKKLKENWQIITIGLLVLFGMNKCTVSCNRANKISKQDKELIKLDSTIKVMSDSIKTLNSTIINLNDKNGMLSEFNRLQSKSDSLNRVAQKEQMKQVNQAINRLKTNSK